MSNVAKLCNVAGRATGSAAVEPANVVDGGLARLLALKNGFFAYNNALEVFPWGPSSETFSISEWNDLSLWKTYYGDMAPLGLCFAQDIFGSQYMLHRGVSIFDPETAEVEKVANSIEEWAGLILADPSAWCGAELSLAWQACNGALGRRQRLVPITPFVLGGEFSESNLAPIDAVRGMKLRAELATQIRDLPEGFEVIYKVT
jgi:hypothetical protein